MLLKCSSSSIIEALIRDRFSQIFNSLGKSFWSHFFDFGHLFIFLFFIILAFTFSISFTSRFLCRGTFFSFSCSFLSFSASIISSCCSFFGLISSSNNIDCSLYNNYERVKRELIERVHLAEITHHEENKSTSGCSRSIEL
jgi:hypothetical protein